MRITPPTQQLHGTPQLQAACRAQAQMRHASLSPSAPLRGVCAEMRLRGDWVLDSYADHTRNDTFRRLDRQNSSPWRRSTFLTVAPPSGEVATLCFSAAQIAHYAMCIQNDWWRLPMFARRTMKEDP